MPAASQQDRIGALFSRLRAGGGKAFVSYLCAGDPDPDQSLVLCRTLIEEGTHILELGVPFSDPLADGKTNQQAAERALSAGVRQADVLDLVRKLRSGFEGPIVFYTYYNLIFSTGLAAYVRQARDAGVDALLCLDLPPEEAEEYLRVCRREGMRTVFIVAPTTPAARIPLIARCATGFIYYVSREGVTGEGGEIAPDLAAAVGRIREATELPVVVGFGVSNTAQVRTVAAAADGVVVGSALVNCIGRNPGNPDAMVAELRRKIADLIGGLT